MSAPPALRYLSVCSGIEAASVAWEPLGWQPVAVAEIDPFACAVLAHRFPNVPNLGDFTKIGKDDLGTVELLVGGTPCQDFSVAGLRTGLDGDRGQLTVEFLHLARRLRPEWLVWENVPGVLSADGGRAFGTFLGILGELGYGFAYRVLDAQHFGVPQRRRRVFVVGYLGDWRRAAAVLFERASLSGNPPPSRKSGQVAPTIPARSSAGGGLGTDFDCDCDGGLVAYSPSSFGQYSEGIKALRAGGTPAGKDPLVVAHTLKAEGFDASEDGTGRGVPLVPVAFTCKDGGADAGSVAPTLRAMHHDAAHANGGGQVAVAFANSGSHRHNGVVAFAMRGREAGSVPEVNDEGQVVSALRAASGGSTRDMIAGSAVRRLTPRECERLMGFHDDFTLVPYRKKAAADGPRYRALGNSMAVPVMRWIGERIARLAAAGVPAEASEYGMARRANLTVARSPCERKNIAGNAIAR